MKMRHLTSPLRRALPLAISLALPFSVQAAESPEAARLTQLEAELKAVQAQLNELRQNASMANGDVAPMAARSASTEFSSYGEINYNRPVHNTDASQADLRRVVLGFQHRFDETTKVNVELEWEHAVTSADDAGEAAVEQAYVEHALSTTLSVKGGLILIPMGLLNEHHEPTAYYGVERNLVETAIIPSTWREGGVSVVASLDDGLTLQGGISTSFDLGKWDGSSTEGQESPLGAVHQELSLAKAKDAALFAAVDWRGMPGLQVGASVFGGPAGQDNVLLENASILLWETHARWTPGTLDISALYARGSISHTEAFNTSIVGNVALMPELFDGYYVQLAWKAWQNDHYSVAPFLRQEQTNTGASYAFIGAGVTPQALDDTRLTTVGANVGIGQNVVLKIDGQRYDNDASLNRIDLGIGWSF